MNSEQFNAMKAQWENGKERHRTACSSCKSEIEQMQRARSSAPSANLEYEKAAKLKYCRSSLRSKSSSRGRRSRPQKHKGDELMLRDTVTEERDRR
ncbi:MAG: hypothetical protein ACLRSD_00985 [Oscillibacter sp.]